MSPTITENHGLSEAPDWSKEQHSIQDQVTYAPIPLRPFSKEATLPLGRLASFSSWQIENPKVEEYDPFSGCVQVFGALLKKWELTRKEGALLLGYENKKDASDFLLGLKKLQTRDAKDRIRYLFKIHSILYGLFEDAQVENDWLREPNDYIEGKIPLDILKEGSMESLLFVKQFVEQISGH